MTFFILITSVILIYFIRSKIKEKKENSKLDLTADQLFNRNIEIISKFTTNINEHENFRYYIENMTRDCIAQICINENQHSLSPGQTYLHEWKFKAPANWCELSDLIFNQLKNEKFKKSSLAKEVKRIKEEFNQFIKNKIDARSFKKIKQHDFSGDFFIDDLQNILHISKKNWIDLEEEIIECKFLPKEFPSLDISIETDKSSNLKQQIKSYNSELKENIAIHKEVSEYFRKIRKGFKNKSKEDVLKRIDYILNFIPLPSSLPKKWNTNFNEQESIVLIEFSLPDIVHQTIYKKVKLKTKTSIKHLSKTEHKKLGSQIHPSIILKIAHDIFYNDPDGVIKLLVINGWVEYNSPATGLKEKTFTSSLCCNRDQITNINVEKLDPYIAFKNLNGKSAGSLIDIVPITPILSLDKNDSRIIDTKEVIDQLEDKSNLASMDWKDFENLIAELFQKEFMEKGAEVKVTQSSRDRGVDAIAFDPDPIKGGKFVIQAKRYTRTVDVSAVRDLCAVVQKEGASRGILVTTSSYGADAYEFAKNEPITLLDGAQLLGLLQKHGYNFRINLEEARKYLKENK